MEDNLKFLVPCRDNHAVKEASLNIFIDRPINDFEAFKKLTEGSLAESFGNFEILNAQDVEINLSKDNESLSRSGVQPIGFRITQKNREGKVVRAFQGINERNRSYFSFHDLEYIRWHKFRELYVNCISSVVGLQDFNVKAFALHYLDEFDWRSSDPVPFMDIFMNDGGVIPKRSLGSNSLDLIYTRGVHSKEPTLQNKMVERVQINGTYSGKNTGSRVVISHNLSQIVEKNLNVTEFVTSGDFFGLVDDVHELNKDFLRTLLVKEIQDRIGLDGK